MADPLPKYARVNIHDPSGFAQCDRCSFWYNREMLSWQYEWGGMHLYSKSILVCPRCIDIPQEQLRTIILPPDPPPIVNSRVPNYAYQEFMVMQLCLKGQQDYVVYPPWGAGPQVDMADQTGEVNLTFQYIYGNPGPLILPKFITWPPRQPFILSVVPNHGFGGATVHINGLFFSNATSVTFGGIPALFYVVNDDDDITAIAPQGSGTVDIQVTTPLGHSFFTSTDKFTYDVPIGLDWYQVMPPRPNRGVGRGAVVPNNFFEPSSSMGPSFGTWDPLTLNNVTLSNNNLTNSNTGVFDTEGDSQGDRATGVLSTGKYYFELTYHNPNTVSDSYGVGIGSAGGNYNGFNYAPAAYGALLFGPTTMDIYADSQFTHNTLSTLGTGGDGNVIAIAADLTDGLVWFQIVAGPDVDPTNGWNGNNGDPVGGTGGASIPLGPKTIFGTYSDNETGESFTLNLTGPFSGTVPSGYTTGWPATAFVPSVTGAVWDGVTATNVTLSNGPNPPYSGPGLTVSDLTVTSTDDSQPQGVQAAAGFGSGKYYFEMTCTSAPSNPSTPSAKQYFIGVGSQSFTDYSNLLNDFTGGAGIGADISLTYSNGSNASYNFGTNLSTGDILGIAIDLDHHKAWFRLVGGPDYPDNYWNGQQNSSSGPAGSDPAANVTGVTIPSSNVFPSAIFGYGADTLSQVMTFNFGATAFTGAVPVGFASGWGAINRGNSSYTINEGSTDPWFRYIVYLCGFEASITDESTTNNKGIGTQQTGPPVTSIAQFKIGQSSIFLGTSGAFSYANSTDWNFPYLFTIEGWFYTTTIAAGTAAIIGQWGASGNLGWVIRRVGATLTWSVTTNGTTVLTDITSAATLTANTWFAYAIDFDGIKYRMYINGALAGSSTTIRSIFASTALLGLGGDGSSVSSELFAGYLDETRITNGVARYASDSGYTVSTQPFPRYVKTVYSGGSLILISNDAAEGVNFFVVPTGYTTLVGEAWGGGGGGAGSANTSAGGGGGGYSSFTTSVTAGQTIYFNVGSRGICVADGAGTAGSNSWVNPSSGVQPVSNGCVGGGGSGSATGTGGSGTVGTTNFTGGNGHAAVGSQGGGGGGGAGSAGNGSSSSGVTGGAGGGAEFSFGGIGGTGVGQDGVIPAGGGGGGKGGFGGSGGIGQIRLTFTGPSTTYTTLDPSSAHKITLSNGNLTATPSDLYISEQGVTVATASGKTSGKYYFEVTFTSIVNFRDITIGVAAPGSDYVNFNQTATGGAAVLQYGEIFSNGTDYGFALVGFFTVLDVVGVAVDLDNRQIWFNLVDGSDYSNQNSWNGFSPGGADPATNLNGVSIPSGTMVPIITFAGEAGDHPGDAVSANFGQVSFAGNVPAGFTAGWPA